MKNTKIGNIRAFAILLVVLGHSIIMYTGWDIVKTTQTIPYIKVLKRFINVIEMPLFMSVSGYVHYYSRKKSFIPFVWNKVQRLLIPYVCVGALWMAPLRMVMDIKHWTAGYFENIWQNIICQKSVGHLWYLISLFLIFLIMYGILEILKRIKGSASHDLVILTVLLLVSYAAKDGLLFTSGGSSIKRVFYYLFWFFLGYLLNKYSGTLSNTVEKRRQFPVVLAVVFLVSFGLYNVKGGNILYYIAAFSSVMLTYAIMPMKTNWLASFMEKNSYGLYLFHSPMVYVTFSLFAESNPYFVVAANVIVLGFISMGITCLLRNSPLAFIVGEKYASPQKVRN